MRLDPNNHTASLAGANLPVTVTEFLVLYELVRNPGQIKILDSLMTAAYEDQMQVDDRTIHNHIKQLQNKFKQIDGNYNAIQSLYRVGYRFDESKANSENVIYCGNLRVYPERRAVRWKDTWVEVTALEFIILRAMVAHHHVHTRYDLIAAARRGENIVDERVIDKTISRLRKKFRDVDSKCALIETVRNLGYQLSRDIVPNHDA